MVTIISTHLQDVFLASEREGVVANDEVNHRESGNFAAINHVLQTRERRTHTNITTIICIKGKNMGFHIGFVRISITQVSQAMQN